MVKFLVKKLPNTWEAVRRKTKVMMSLVPLNIPSVESMSYKVEQVWKNRKNWVDDVAPTILCDIRTAVMGEAREEMIFSDVEGNFAVSDDEMDENNVNDFD